VSRLLATALGLAEPVTTRRGVLTAQSVLAERVEPLLLVIEDADSLATEERELLLSLVRSLGASGSVALLVSSRDVLEGEGVMALQCGALSASVVEAWAAPLLSDKKLRELVRHAGGSPKKIEQFLAETLGSAEPLKTSAGAVAALAGLAPVERATLALLSTVGA
jgi:hypothetical protein